MDDVFFTLIGFAAIGVFFLPLILAIVAMKRTADLRRRIQDLEARIVPVPAPETVAEPEVPVAPIVVEIPAEPPPVVTEDAIVAEAPRQKAGIEEKLTSRWLVWLGAVALVLAGLFLIKYAVDNALLTPAMRAGMGLLLGVALTLAGEWLRRQPEQRDIGALKADYVPGALTSAGLFIAFASIYGAHALLGLIGPMSAFIGLAAVAVVAFALAALHTPIVAIIGLLAGFTTPLLIDSPEGNPWLLFSYLTLIIAAAYGVVVYRGWGWLAYGATAGGLAWVLLWTLKTVAGEDLPAIAVFLAILTAAALWLALRLTPPAAPTIWGKPHQPQGPELNAWIAAGGSVVLGVLAAHEANALPVALVYVALGAAALAWTGRLYQRFDALMLHAAVLMFATLCSWDPEGILGQILYDETVGNLVGSAGSLIAPVAEAFVNLHLLSAAGLAAAGFFLLRGARRPAVWAGFSVLGAIAILAAAYARSRYFTLDLLWTMVAAGSAALAVAAVGTLLRDRTQNYPSRFAIGLYAAAAVAGVSFAFAFVFREAWLTIALALQLPALAWLEKALDLKDLRRLAMAVAAVILVRLALNPYVLSYETTHTLGHHWVIYGYGIPAAAFYLASRQFLALNASRTVAVLESGALVFALLLLSLEIRIFTEGSIAATRLTLSEAALHSLVWLAAGWWRGRMWRASGTMLDAMWGAVLLTLGIATVVVLQLLVLNPVVTNEPVAGYPVFNGLIVAYLVPAVLTALITRDLGLSIRGRDLRAAGFGLAGILIFAWLTLETKRTFQGPAMEAWARSDAEYYAYSAVWLAFSFVLLGLGLWRREPWLRHGALAILIIAVCKVFLADMAALGGLYRVASFLGLGLCLVGIGYLYQRFVFRPPPESPGEAPG
ncbi:DUF2339 domain-containing protein [soil metagenome]